MRTHIQGLKFHVNGRLHAHLQEKLNKLRQFHDGVLDAQVTLRLERDREHGNKLVEVKILVPNDTLVASERGQTFERAADRALDQIVRQLKRQKAKARAA